MKELLILRSCLSAEPISENLLKVESADREAQNCLNDQQSSDVFCSYCNEK